MVGGHPLGALIARCGQEPSFKKNFIYGVLAGAPYYAYAFYWILYFNVWSFAGTWFCHLPFLGVFLALTGCF